MKTGLFAKLRYQQKISVPRHEIKYGGNNIIFDFFRREDIPCTAQKMKFSIKDFFSKCDQMRSSLRIWSHLLKKSLMENFHFLCSGD